jgi:hypothetical protein
VSAAARQSADRAATAQVGYAVVQSVVWASIALASPPTLLNLSSGLIGCAVNLLPSILPAAVLNGDGRRDLSVLAVVGVVGACAFALAAHRLPRGSSAAATPEREQHELSSSEPACATDQAS